MGGAISIREAERDKLIDDVETRPTISADGIVNGKLSYINDIKSALVLFALGVKYERGVDEPVDIALAASCYRKAAERGHSEAQFKLGEMYFLGRGVENDNVQAFRWYREAAKQGSPHAQFNLGCMHFEGMGVVKDWGSAMKWFELSASQGHEKAANALAFMSASTEDKQIRIHSSFSVAHEF